MDDPSTLLQQELENMASNASTNPPPSQTSSDSDSNSPHEPITITAHRWQRLFNLPFDTAIEAIVAHRQNLIRTRISPDHWEILRAEKEAEGYDREAYEYEVELQKKKAALPDLLPAADDDDDGKVTYLVELTGPLGSVENVQKAAGLEATPVVVSGKSVEDERDVSLCCIDAKAKTSILRWASNEGGGFEPTILVDPRSLR